MPYANNKDADQPAQLLLAASYIRCCRHIKEFLRTKVSLSITFFSVIKIVVSLFLDRRLPFADKVKRKRSHL